MKHKLMMMFPLFTLIISSSISASEVYLFEEIDLDHNGAISRSEAAVRDDLSEDFTEIDTDGNKSLSVDEYSNYMNKGVPPEDVEVPEPGAAPVM